MPPTPKPHSILSFLSALFQSFSAIVGPNGSGKSNVIDALLFVFGKRASKIRLKKISELIHNSAQHPNLKACRVSVYFHLIRDISDEGYETLEGSEFCITRTADHKSKSQYFIDGAFDFSCLPFTSSSIFNQFRCCLISPLFFFHLLRSPSIHCIFFLISRQTNPVASLESRNSSLGTVWIWRTTDS